MKKKNVKKVLPRPEYQSPYAPKPPKQSAQTENNKTLNTEILYKEERHEEETSPYVSMSDSLYQSPYETMEEKIARSQKLRGTPTHNPRVEKELAKKKQSLPEETYESPFESKEYKNKILYKEEEIPTEAPSHKESPSSTTSLSDAFYESPFDSIEEKMEKVYYQKSTPSYNPVVEKELKRKKRNLSRDPSEEEYESPFESEAYKDKKLYKEEEDFSQEDEAEEAPSLYQSHYEKVEEQRANQTVDEGYNSFDLPYIETRVTSHIRGSRVMDYAFENANMDEDQQEVHYRQMKYAKIFLLASLLSLVALLILNLPPRLRHYHGELGTYEIYHFQTLIVTPEGEEITYARKTYQNALYYSFFMPDGEEVRTTSLHEGIQLHVGRQSLLTEQEQELYNALIIVEEDYRKQGDSYHESNGILYLIQIYHVALGIFCVLCPYYLIDFAVFCYPASSPEFRTVAFRTNCRNCALAYAIFSSTPWGGAFHINLIMNTIGRVINQWAGIMYASMGN